MKLCNCMGRKDGKEGKKKKAGCEGRKEGRI
jgi:hypothetical protein